jgi:hypothetical protein
VVHGESGLSLIPAQRPSFFSGSLNALSLGNVFAQLLANVDTGKLTLASGSSRRTVSLREGQIVFATSSERHERLGSALVRLGLISREQLDKALLQVSSKARLGQVLTRMGVVSDANLYNALTFLVREIVVNLFEWTKGSFLFVEGGLSPDSLKLPERTQSLVLEGMKRGDEVARLRQRLPFDLKVKLGPDHSSTGDELATHVAKGITLAELRPRFEGSEHSFLHWVDEQVRSGDWVTVEPQELPAIHGLAASSVVSHELFAQLLAEIYGALREAGEDPDWIQSFLDHPPKGLETAFAGVTISDAGLLDLPRLLSNLGGDDDPRARLRLYEALDSLVAYALFSAHNRLPAVDAEELTAQFRRMRGER